MKDINRFIKRFETGLTALEGVSWPEARRRYDTVCQQFAPPDPAGLGVKDESVASVAVRRFVPFDAAASGAVLYVHGGGFTIGSVRSHHGIAASLAEALGHEVMSVEYRLAPAATYADMLADCHAVAGAITPIAMVGDSAGGRLVMDLAKRLNAKLPLGLIYPPVEGLYEDTLGPDAPLLSRADVLSLHPFYPETQPASLASTPPSFALEVLAVEHDPLTAPLEKAVMHWRSAGANIGYRCAPGMVHGALHAHALLPNMQNAWQDFCQALVSLITR
ncbi:alpha/beta hydrolase fold domain-containing protein [Halomonas vilamensis]|uniref:Alpha/beta hydrolase fold domain-containing protein n=1 Tax=Vreelandella vilamensis TaxID=531309 RepID=A0ABU1H352_9GAMM|nr:alpha/beta hydrolase fold domain-containing protein [Halomonas vilamensis]MDR5898187.1 alpha/beta hydrolase fold domain-containing protein [Halomonas vilamensis]